MIFSIWTSTVAHIFLLHKFGVQIIPFKLEKSLKKTSKGKKESYKPARSLLREDANYDHERNDP